MTRLFRRLVAAFVFAFATGAHAAPLSPDPSGYWYNPGESGWGASIAQQNDVVFVALLVYDEQKRASWFVATNVRDTGNGVFSGPLYRTTGPFFGASFNPSGVDVQSVGTITVRYGSATPGQESLRLDYTVSGVAVSKTLVRMTWESNRSRMLGSYFGGINVAIAPLPQPFSCPTDPNTFFPPGGQITIAMADANTISIGRGEGIDVIRAISGVYEQSGQLGTITGGLFSGIVVAPIRIGDAVITNLVVNDDGFVGHLQLTENGCVFEGSIGGVRRPR